MKRFQPEQFTPTEHSSAQDKAKFATAFIRFVEGGFQQKDFHKWFYQRLSMTFGHIAHYNQQGFWDTFFTSPQGKLEFVQQCLEYGCYGDPAFTYCDVEKALQKWMRSQDIMGKVREAANTHQVESELATRDALCAKFGVPKHMIGTEHG